MGDDLSKGLFITLEGLDGCGKSTQVELLAEFLREVGFSVIVTREPGGCQISEAVREILLDPASTGMTAETEALLYTAARAQHVAQVIAPALAAGDVVISDRFLDSSLAYQGSGRRLGMDNVVALNESAVAGVMPDLTFFLDVAPQAAFARMERESHDRLEMQDPDFYEAVYAGYLKLCEEYPERLRRIDASGSTVETQARIREDVQALVDSRSEQH